MKQKTVQCQVSDEDEDEGCTSLRNSGIYLLYYTATYCSRT
jgi:hypothetical protein